MIFFYIGLFFGSLQVKIKRAFFPKNMFKVFIATMLVKIRLWDEPFYIRF